MKQLFLIFALFAGAATSSFAQSSKPVNQNEEAVKNFDGTGGRFEFALNERERVNVSYALTPKKPTATARFMIHTPMSTAFSAAIVDASGKTVYNWKPQDVAYAYDVNWNLSALAKGEYTVKIFLNNKAESVNEFTFSKN